MANRGPDHQATTGDPEGLRRALDNLVENGLRHGTAVTVALAAPELGWLVVDVEDDGPGIPDVDKARVLEPFERGDLARGMDGGTGVGLTNRPGHRAGAWRGDQPARQGGRRGIARLRLPMDPPHEKAPPERG